MRAMARGFVSLLIAVLGSLLAPGVHAAISAQDAMEVQRIVRAQLDAFAADDAERAFSYAAPSIRTMFGTPSRFIEMVRTTYPVVYRPKSVRFLQAQENEDSVLQPVQMTDGRGASWVAVYTLQRQDDLTSWRIAGCVLLAQGGQVI